MALTCDDVLEVAGNVAFACDVLGVPHQLKEVADVSDVPDDVPDVSMVPLTCDERHAVDDDLPMCFVNLCTISVKDR